ncbi:arginine--tRNA ligase, partial [Planctomycetota bacterium]
MRNRVKQRHRPVLPFSQLEPSLPLPMFEVFYKEAKQRYDNDTQFAEAAREAVVCLHNHDPKYTLLWQRIVNESRCHYQSILYLLFKAKTCILIT